MAYRIRMTVFFDWVGDGTGPSMLGQYQAENPGFGTAPAQNPGPVGMAQTLSLLRAELVPGGDSPSQANFNTALSNAISDIETDMGTGGTWGGNAATPLSIIQGWSTGNP